MSVVKDAMGVEIKVGDKVMIIGYGWGILLPEVGHTVTVVGFTPKGNVKHDGDEANGKALHAECLAVRRRDGFNGHEANKPVEPKYRLRCTECATVLDDLSAAHAHTSDCGDDSTWETSFYVEVVE